MDFETQVKKQLAYKFQNDEYATNFYRAISNMRWKRLNDKNNIFKCSWRFAGGLVARIRNKDETYIDFYCSGNEGNIDNEIKKDLNQLGWVAFPWEKEELESLTK